MKKTILSFLVFAIAANLLIAQSSLYIPRNILSAYEKGTRSFEGKPGPKYWVNYSDYKIEAEVLPLTRSLNGYERVTYYNNSPDTLNSFVIRLYADVFKKGSARDFSTSPQEITDGIKIDTLIINGVGVNFESKEYHVRKTATNLFINNFPVKVAPGEQAKIEVKWKLPPIPKQLRIRMGAYNDSTFYFAYWYPQIAVYDDIDGWDSQEYGGYVEFYNDTNNFDVELTAPGNYLIWATGLIQNAKELYQPEIYERYQKAQNSDDEIKIISEEDYTNKKVYNGKEQNTWHFIAENVPDFSFAACSHYLWRGTSININGRRVFIDAICPVGAKFENEIPKFAKLGVEYFSKEWPGIPFPYPKITAFSGEQGIGGGMETPMMCNDGTYKTRGGQIVVTVHESAHTYFPFYMGTNERKYAWMDEGWATFFTFDLVKRLEPDEDELPAFIAMLNHSMGNDYMLPLVTPSYSVKTEGTGLMFYQQPAIAYLILKDFLGSELFGKCLREYMSRWHYKHPIPYDFFFTFDNVAREDLSWFWKPWFFEQGFPDLGIKKVDNGNEVVIERIGNYPVPLDLKITFDDSTSEIIHKTAAVWKHGEREIKVKTNKTKKINKAELLTLLGPDVNPKNNYYKSK